MKKIPLTRGLFAIVDDDDFESLSKHKWFADKGNSTFYANRHHSKGKNIRMHRQIMCVTDKRLDVDHKNGNGLDNRKCNLRVCSRSSNNANAKISRRNRSGFKGVCWDSSRNKWGAQIGFNGKKYHLGRFDKIENAVSAYNKKAKELFGEFVRLS